MEQSYPIFLNLTNRKCIVVGGGRVGRRKVEGLLSTGARIVVISPHFQPELQALADEGKIECEAREFAPTDLDDADLVFAATDQPELNQKIAQLAHNKAVWINTTNDSEQCDFFVPSTVRRGALSVAISTSGFSPVLTRRLRLQAERSFGQEYEVFFEFLGEWRKKLMERIPEQQAREEIFRSIVNSDCLEWLRRGRTEKANNRVEQIIEEYL